MFRAKQVEILWQTAALFASQPSRQAGGWAFVDGNRKPSRLMGSAMSKKLSTPQSPRMTSGPKGSTGIVPWDANWVPSPVTVWVSAPST